MTSIFNIFIIKCVFADPQDPQIMKEQEHLIKKEQWALFVFFKGTTYNELYLG